MRLIRRRTKAAHPSDVLDRVSILLARCRTSSTRNQLVDHALTLLQELVPADSLLLLEYPSEKSSLRILNSLGQWSSLSRDLFELDRRSEDAEPVCRLRGIPLREALHPADAAAQHFWDTPLRAYDRIVGSLWLGRSLGGLQDFSADERRTAGMIADVIACGLLQDGLQERTDQQQSQLTAMRAVERAITSSMDLNVTLNVFLDQVMTQLQVDASAILLLDPQSRDLTQAAARGFRKTNRPQSRIRTDHTLALQASLERKITALDIPRPEDPERIHHPLMREEEFLAYYAAPLIAHGQVRGVLEVFRRSAANPDPDWPERMESLALQGAIAIVHIESLQSLQRTQSELAMTCDSTIEGWSRAVDLRAHEAEGHGMRVSELAVRTAERMGIAPDRILPLRRGALLHDIGKIGVPDRILWKPEALSEEEWGIMRQHPKYAEHLLEPVEFLRPALDIPKFHHERWDGNGYPYGLAGNDIPLAARIFSVVDVWDSMQAARPFRNPCSEADTVAYIQQSSGKQFDPEVVDSFMQILQEPEG